MLKLHKDVNKIYRLTVQLQKLGMLMCHMSIIHVQHTDNAHKHTNTHTHTHTHTQHIDMHVNQHSNIYIHEPKLCKCSAIWSHDCDCVHYPNNWHHNEIICHENQ